MSLRKRQYATGPVHKITEAEIQERVIKVCKAYDKLVSVQVLTNLFFVTFVSEVAKRTQLLPRAPAYSRSSQAKSDPSTPTLWQN